MDNIFDEFIVVDEKLYADIKFNYKDETFTDVSQFFSLKLIAKFRGVCLLTITDIGDYMDSESSNADDASSKSSTDSGDDSGSEASTDNGDDSGSKAFDAPPLAQIIRWRWDWKGRQEISGTWMLKNGQELRISHGLDSFIVRILKKKKETTNDSLCPSLSSPDDDLTVKIGREKITVSAHWLMSVSPMFCRMLSVEMREKKQRLVTLNDLDVDMAQFKEFLEAISPIALPNTFYPTPKNVLMLLKLAHYFQVDWLKKRCDLHLINCVEIPIIDRFLLIKEYGLNNLKNYFLHLNVDELRIFFEANGKKVLANKHTSKEFLYLLIKRTCTIIREENGNIPLIDEFNYAD